MKLSRIIFAITLFTVSFSYAQHHDHKTSHKAHVHGVAELGIALEKNNKVAFDLDLPGDTAVGFEHAPKTEAEKAKVQKIEATFKNDFSKLVSLPADAKCVWGNPKIEVNYEDKGHSAWEIEIFSVCASPIVAKDIGLAFKPHFPGLSTLGVSVIGEDFQKKHTIKDGTGTIHLSK